MSLLIDVGNTRTKWFLTDASGQLKDMGVWENMAIEQVDLSPLALQTNMALIAAVGAQSVQDYLVSYLESQGLLVKFVQSAQQACGVQNRYQQVKRLGVDRWLSLIAAYQAGYGDCLVVTAGTAVTIDALAMEDEQGVFLGGTIMPGLQLMQKALHQYTANLPIAQGAYQAFPVDTGDAIHTGALNAICGAIAQQWQQLEEHVGIAPKLVLSGGDAKVITEKISPKLAEHVIIVDNLVLRGLMHWERENIS